VFETIAIVSTLVFASIFTGLIIMNNRASKETADRLDPPHGEPKA